MAQISHLLVDTQSKFPFLELPSVLKQNIVKKSCRHPASLDRDIRSIASTSKQMGTLANNALLPKINVLMEQANLSQKNICRFTDNVDRMAKFFQDREEKMEIIPVTQKERKIFAENVQFNEQFESFSKIRKKAKDLYVKMSEAVLTANKSSSFWVNYRIYRATQKDLTSLQLSAREVSKFYKENFESTAKNLQLELA